ncbi:hypothetical protein N2152v2_000380 [Parachlorella kessleri]
MALMISRAATVYSLTQLEGNSDDEGHQHGLTTPVKGFLSAPECAVKDVEGSLLPLYRFPGQDGFLGAKRTRSFGDLYSAVPDVNAPRGLNSPALAYSSEDEFGFGEASMSSGSDSMVVPQMNQVFPQRSLLDTLLLAEWEDRAEQGLFRYDVTACPTKVVPGAYGFIAQCNEGRASKKRPTEFRVDQVSQPFDDTKFNFTKAKQKEVLFQLEPAPGGASPSYSAAAPAPVSPHLVLINVSPIEYGHVLLVPRVVDKIPQLVAPDTLLLALQFAREADNPYFRLSYNSLGAYGTINHLHYQAYYLEAPFAIERAPTAPLAPAASCAAASAAAAAAGRGAGLGRKALSPRAGTPRRAVSIQQLLEYPVRTLVFEAGDSLEELADVVGRACQRLTAANVPHNLLIADCGARVFLYPNCFAERKAKGEIPEDILATQVDPAGWEIAGHIVLKRQEDYATVSQEWAWRLLSYASYPEDRFFQVACLALGGPDHEAGDPAAAGCCGNGLGADGIDTH